MAIEVTFKSDFISEIRQQMLDYLAATGVAPSLPPKAVPVSEPVPPPERAARAPVAEPEAIPGDAGGPEAEEPIMNGDAVEAEKLKTEVIRSLESLYKNGKVKVIRSALTKYGDGAKSFLEIDASKFREIREALAKGEIA